MSLNTRHKAQALVQGFCIHPCTNDISAAYALDLMESDELEEIVAGDDGTCTKSSSSGLLDGLMMATPPEEMCTTCQGFAPNLNIVHSVC